MSVNDVQNEDQPSILMKRKLNTNFKKFTPEFANDNNNSDSDNKNISITLSI